MAVLDTLKESGLQLPSMNMEGAVGTIAYAGIGIVAALVIAGGIFLYYYNFVRFDKIVWVWGDINGVTQILIKDRGYFERVGIAGDYWLRTKSQKKILSRPSIRVGPKMYWYYLREDGEYINFGIENIDTLQKAAKAKYVDEDMRLNRLGVERNLTERFRKISFWDKYGTMIAWIVFMLICTVALVIVLKRIDEILKAIPAIAGALSDVARTLADISTRTTSGLVPVNGTG